MLSTLSTRIATPARLRWLLAFVLLVTLIAGLDPKGYRFRNEVAWIAPGPGLRFGKFGGVHTAPFLTSGEAAALNRAGFSMETAFSLDRNTGGGYRFLVSFHAVEDRCQLVVGQWREQIIVMNGDDYSHRRGLPRIAADTSKCTTGNVLLTITTGPGGTRLYLNGRESAVDPDLHLTLPVEQKNGRLIVGNSVHAGNPWRGDVLGFALYPRVLSPDQVLRHLSEWASQNSFSSGQLHDPFVLYAFDEGSGGTARDASAHHADIEIPSRLVALGRRAFAPITRDINNMESFVKDVTVNVLGFIPFGFLLASLLRTSLRSNWKLALVTTAAGFLLSFVIELIQAWMPSRDSSLLDLLMNTTGTLLGTLIVVLGCFLFRTPALERALSNG